MDYKNRPLNVNYNVDTFQCGTIGAGDTNIEHTEQDHEIDADTDESDEVKCIFLCKFHATAGPQIAAQVPKNYISKELFDTVSSYIIPKVPLQRSFLSV